MRSSARERDSTSEGRVEADEGAPERYADQKWERNSVVVAWVRERRSKVVEERPWVDADAAVVKVGLEGPRESPWGWRRMEERIWSEADLNGDFAEGGLDL